MTIAGTVAEIESIIGRVEVVEGAEVEVDMTAGPSRSSDINQVLWVRSVAGTKLKQ